ncbi:MAG: hypothetical protein R6V01_09980 [Thermoplasmatota archaeon]
MKKNLYGHLIDLDRLLWSQEFSGQDKRRELDHFLYRVERIMREDGIISLDEVKRTFYAARSIIDQGFCDHYSRAVIVQGLALRRMARNPLVKKDHFMSLSGSLSSSVEMIEGLSPDRWTIDAYIEAGKAFERSAARTRSNIDLKRSGRSYSKALKLSKDQDKPIIGKRLEKRLKGLKRKIIRGKIHGM